MELTWPPPTVNQSRFRRYVERVPAGTGFLRDALIASRSDEHRAGERRVRRRPRTLAAARRVDAARTVAARRRRRRPGPLRQRAWPTWPALRRGRARPAGVAGAQHPGVVPASARLARPGPRVGRPGDGAGRFRRRGGCRRADRTGRRRARRGPVRGIGSGAASAPASCRPERRRRGCRCGWRGCPRNWRWPAATARRPSATPSGPSSWPRRSARRGTPSNRTSCWPRRCAAPADLDASAAVADAALDDDRAARNRSRCAGRWRACWPTSAAPTHSAAAGAEDSRRMRRYGASPGRRCGRER